MIYTIHEYEYRTGSLSRDFFPSKLLFHRAPTSATRQHLRSILVLQQQSALVNQALKMGKGKRWLAPENRDLAIAWIHVSEDAGNPTLKGTNQDSREFWASVIERLKEMAPTQEDTEGMYGDRNISAIQNHWSENIARQAKKFNKALARVYAANPTGVTEEQKVNMAVAIHLGKIDAMSYRFKDFEANTWKFFLAWQILKSHPAFLPPRMPTEDEVLELDDDNVFPRNGQEIFDQTPEDSTQEAYLPLAQNSQPTEETPVRSTQLFSNRASQNQTDPASHFGNKNGNGNPTQQASTIQVPRSASSSNSDSEASSRPRSTHKHSRGGLGRTATKKAAVQDEYRKRKSESLEALVNIQKQRREDFSQFVTNTAQVSAFNMANTMMEKALKLNRSDEAEYHYKTMQDIVGGETAAD